MPFAYIIYSPTRDRFYIGSTSTSISERIDKHINGHYPGKHFTSQAKDWSLFLAINCESLTQAQKIERHLKKMKSRKYLVNLKTFPEMVEKLLSNTQSL